MFSITPSPPMPSPPIDPREDLGASGFAGLIVLRKPSRLPAEMLACSPAAESARTGAGEGGGGFGFFADPPMMV